MTWDDVQENWDDVRDRFREQYGKLSEEDLEDARKNREHLLDLVQSTYGISRAAAEQELEQFLETI